MTQELSGKLPADWREASHRASIWTSAIVFLLYQSAQSAQKKYVYQVRMLDDPHVERSASN